MKRISLLLMCLVATVALNAQNFADYFADKTLRVDYLFTGNHDKQEICLDELSSLPQWAGRKHHLAELPLEGNGQVTMRDADGKVIYKTSFSALFFEWLETDEAKVLTKGFEHTVLLPFPLKPVEVEAVLFDQHRAVRCSLVHKVDPTDILIRQRGTEHITPHKYVLKSGDVDKCIDVAFLAEGYRADEMETFYQDAARACEAFFSHEPYKSMKDRFNIVAVASPSVDSGVSVPRKEIWKNTAFGSHFSTFYSDRYLTSTRVKAINNALAGVPYEHIIVLVNSEEYGGGGIYNSYTLTTAHHATFQPVIVHEFGHSFGGLADEYFYDDDVTTDTYALDSEPWEQNITTLTDFSRKWGDLLSEGTPVPTPVADKEKYAVGVYEGGGYSSKGIYRPAYDCRMRTNECPTFCPVCERAIRRVIEFYTNE